MDKKFELGKVDVMYPNENDSKPRNFILRPDGEYLQFDFIDEIDKSGGFTLDVDQVKFLVDLLLIVGILW